MKCIVCDRESPVFQWTDTHGIAQCMDCGAPYQLLHYNDEGERVAREPEALALPQWVAMFRAYWTETKKPMPTAFSFGLNPRYEVATPDESEAFVKWARSRQDEFAAKEAASPEVLAAIVAGMTEPGPVGPEAP